MSPLTPRGGAWLPALAVAPAVGLVGIALYAGSVGDSGAVLAVAILVAGAAFLGGGLLGFLFGIPRSLAGSETEASPPSPSAGDAAARTASYRSNTNLEQISDWLTKILVGVGLVQLGTLTRETGELVDFLAPALGASPSSPAFALALLLLYAISGFLIVYLVTRVYLGRIFARADELMRYVDERIDEVRESQRAQEERDVEALALVNRQLEPEDAAAPVPQEALGEALAGASPLVRAQVFSRARERRRSDDPRQRARTIDVFRALVAADEEHRFHRNHAQLAYALKAGPAPDYEAAKAALDEAIRIRDGHDESGFLLYEFNRALCRIALDPARRSGSASADDDREAVLADLLRAAASPFLRRRMSQEPVIADWLERNGLTVADVQAR